jgi:hypothetical protein
LNATAAIASRIESRGPPGLEQLSGVEADDKLHREVTDHYGEDAANNHNIPVHLEHACTSGSSRSCLTRRSDIRDDDGAYQRGDKSGIKIGVPAIKMM